MTFKNIDWGRMTEFFLYLLNGDFIKGYVIRVVWRVVIYGSLFVAVAAYIIYPLLHLWLAVVNYINYVRWGIQ